MQSVESNETSFCQYLRIIAANKTRNARARKKLGKSGDDIGHLFAAGVQDTPRGDCKAQPSASSLIIGHRNDG